MKCCSETQSRNDITETPNYEPKATKQNLWHESYETEVYKQKLPTVSSKTEVMVPTLRAENSENERSGPQTNNCTASEKIVMQRKL